MTMVMSLLVLAGSISSSAFFSKNTEPECLFGLGLIAEWTHPHTIECSDCARQRHDFYRPETCKLQPRPLCIVRIGERADLNEESGRVGGCQAKWKRLSGGSNRQGWRTYSISAGRRRRPR